MSGIKSKSKINIYEHDDKNVNYLNKRAKSVTNINKKLFDIKDIPSNKMIWNKFNKNFENSLKNLNLTNKEEIDEYVYHQLLFNLGMTSYEPETREKKRN